MRKWTQGMGSRNVEKRRVGQYFGKNKHIFATVGPFCEVLWQVQASVTYAAVT